MHVGTPVRPFRLDQKDLLYETQVGPVIFQEDLPAQHTCMVNIAQNIIYYQII